MDMVPEEVTTPGTAQAGLLSQAGPSRLAPPPMKYWPAPLNAPSASKKVNITVPITGKRFFAQATAPAPCPQPKPLSLTVDLTLEAIVALTCTFPNMMVDKILELWAILTGASFFFFQVNNLYSGARTQSTLYLSTCRTGHSHERQTVEVKICPEMSWQ
jgi:hypothetical protein